MSGMDNFVKRALGAVNGNGIAAHKHAAAAAMPLDAHIEGTTTTAAAPATTVTSDVVANATTTTATTTTTTTTTEQARPLGRLPVNARAVHMELPNPIQLAELEERDLTEVRPVEREPARISESAVHRTVVNALAQCGDIDMCFEGDGYGMGFCDVEYVHEIHAYLLHQERNMALTNPFRNPAIKTTVDPRARAKLIDWMCGMHYTFRLAIESLFLAIQMIDRYFALRCSEIPRDRLELLGITVLFTASKFEESYTPSLRHFLESVKNRYTRSQVSGLEFEVLETLGLNLSYPTAITFIRRYAAVLRMNNRDRYRAFCLAELCLHNDEFITVLPSELAAASCIASLKIAGMPEHAQWPTSLESYSTHSRSSLEPIIDKVMEVAAQCRRDVYRYSISKYSKPQYYDVGPELRDYSYSMADHSRV